MCPQLKYFDKCAFRYKCGYLYLYSHKVTEWKQAHRSGLKGTRFPAQQLFVTPTRHSPSSLQHQFEPDIKISHNRRKERVSPEYG